MFGSTFVQSEDSEDLARFSGASFPRACVTNVLRDAEVGRNWQIELLCRSVCEAHVQLVDMHDAQSVLCQPFQSQIIFTYALNGCQSTCLLSGLGGGTVRATMTHFGWTRKGKHLEDLGDLALKHLTGTDQDAVHVMLIASPGYEILDPQTKKPVRAVERESKCREFSAKVEEVLGCRILCRMLPYLTTDDLGSDTSFSVEWSGVPGDALRYSLHGSSTGEVYLGSGAS